MIQEIARLTGIDFLVCLEAVERVAAYYRDTRLEEIVSLILQYFISGDEIRAVLYQFREEVKQCRSN